MDLCDGHAQSAQKHTHARKNNQFTRRPDAILMEENRCQSADGAPEVKATVPDGKKLLLLEGIDDDAKEKVTDMLGTVGHLAAF